MRSKVFYILRIVAFAIVFVSVCVNNIIELVDRIRHSEHPVFSIVTIVCLVACFSFYVAAAYGAFKRKTGK